MSHYTVIPILSKPGIQRDGTPFASENYIDGQWCRFYMGKPRKIGGYKLIDPGTGEVMRSLFDVPQPNQIILYMGRASSLHYNIFDLNGDGEGEVDVTPKGYIPVPEKIWDFDLFTTTTDPNTKAYIVASAIPNGHDNSNEINGDVYYGIPDISNPSLLSAPLQKIDPGIDQKTGLPNADVEVSGGVVFASPFMVVYGNNGLIRWSEAGRISGNLPDPEPSNPNTDKGAWPDSNTLVIANTKVIQGFTNRGSVNPQILFWTLSSVINVTYTALGTFGSSVIEQNITVMSPRSIVQYNQQFFWIGIDQFYMYNGIVQRLDNTMSTDWFFQHINLSQRAKVWGMALPQYKEIWWFYPRDAAIECNAVVIYNLELNTWYDSVLSRAAGLSPGIFPRPLMSDAASMDRVGRGVQHTYGLWMHEYGVDQVIGEQRLAIPSWFETHMMTLFDHQPDKNRLIRSRRIEPDFQQPNGTHMTVTVHNRMFPSDSLENGNMRQVGPYPFGPDTQKIDDVNSQGRLMSFVFESNEAGGDYQAGKTLLDFDVGDVRP